MKIANNILYNTTFGSNYKYNVTSQNSERAHQAMNILYRPELTDESNYKIYTDFPSFNDSCKTGIFEKVHIAASDNYDEFIESVLKQRNISFEKQSKKTALDLDNIYNRIVLPEGGYNLQLVSVDVEKIDKLFQKNEDVYITPGGKKGTISNRYQGVIDYLKTGRDIDATQANLFERNGELVFSIIDGRHRFSVMRDMGMKKIKLAMNPKSIELAKKYNLIA